MKFIFILFVFVLLTFTACTTGKAYPPVVWDDPGLELTKEEKSKQLIEQINNIAHRLKAEFGIVIRGECNADGCYYIITKKGKRVSKYHLSKEEQSLVNEWIRLNKEYDKLVNGR